MLLREIVAGADVLDCFTYTGGFALNALRGGAKSVTAVDSSGLALDMARANAALNGLRGGDWVEGDVFQTLRKFRDQGRCFDVIVLDPPKFAPTAAHAERASRAYKDINLLAFKMLRPGGHTHDLLVLGRDLGRAFSEDRRRRRARRAGRRAHREMASCGRRSPGCTHFPRERVS